MDRKCRTNPRSSDTERRHPAAGVFFKEERRGCTNVVGPGAPAITGIVDLSSRAALQHGAAWPVIIDDAFHDSLCHKRRSELEDRRRIFCGYRHDTPQL